MKGEIGAMERVEIEIQHNPLEYLEMQQIQLQERHSQNLQVLKYEILCIPFLGHKSIQLLHKDDYLMQNVKFSTFTMNDDIFLMIDRQFYIFDGMGNPMMVKISQEDADLMKNARIEIVRITSNTLVEAGQTFLFTDHRRYFIFHLQYKNMQYVFQKVYEHPVLLPLSGKDFFSEAKQDLHGNLYQVLVEPELANLESVEGPEAAELSMSSAKDRYKIQITYNDRNVTDL